MTLTFQGYRRSNIWPFWEADMRLDNDLLLIWTVYLVPFARYSASKISVGDLDHSGSPKIKYSTFFRKVDIGLYNGLLLIRTVYLVPFARYSAYKIPFCDLDLSRSPKVKYLTLFGKLIWDFMMTFFSYKLSISYRLRDISHLRFRIMTMTFQGHRRSSTSPFLESRYGALLWPSLDNNSILPFARYS